MLKGPDWYQNLNPITCWRFFKYKFVLANARAKFKRDEDMLHQLEKVDIKSVLQYIQCILVELNALEESLALLMTMISLLSN